MNLNFLSGNKLSEVSCDTLRKEKEQINAEIKRRQNIKIDEINERYKERKRYIVANFNDIAKQLGTAIPVGNELPDEIVSEISDKFIDISYRYHSDYAIYDFIPSLVVNDLIRLVSILSEDKEHNLILMLAMNLELEKLEKSRLSDISKITEE